MKKARNDDLRAEYRRKDLSKGVRGKYVRAYRAGTNLVLLEPRVAEAFPTDRAVNEALSSLIEVAEHTLSKRITPSRTKTRRVG
jgi:hypothetical protein